MQTRWIVMGAGACLFAMMGLGVAQGPLRAAQPGAALTTASHVGPLAAKTPQVSELRAASPTAYLSTIAGGKVNGGPVVAAVRENGRVRLVREGDTLDGGVIAMITPDMLTVQTIDRRVVLPRTNAD